jgi:hypothetical protein
VTPIFGTFGFGATSAWYIGVAGAMASVILAIATCAAVRIFRARMYAARLSRRRGSDRWVAVLSRVRLTGWLAGAGTDPRQVLQLMSYHLPALNGVAVNDLLI